MILLNVNILLLFSFGFNKAFCISYKGLINNYVAFPKPFTNNDINYKDFDINSLVNSIIPTVNEINYIVFDNNEKG